MVPYAKRMEKMAFTANVVKGLFGSMTNPDIISFSGGSPAREALPVDTIRQLADEVLRTDTRGVEALQYGPIEGIRDLREVVVRELLAPKGIDCGVDNVIIITGGLEGINLACQAYIDPGDVILVEAPTFVQSVEIFDMFEARCVGVAMDDDGLIPEDLLDHIFRPAVGVGAAGGHILGEGDALRHAVDRGGGTEHDGIHAVIGHGLQQREGGVQIIAVVLQRLLHRFAHGLEAGEVDDGVEIALLEHLLQRGTVGHVHPVKGRGAAGDAADARYHVFGAVAEIVGNDHVIAGLEQLHRRVRADEARAAGY